VGAEDVEFGKVAEVAAEDSAGVDTEGAGVASVGVSFDVGTLLVANVSVSLLVLVERSSSALRAWDIAAANLSVFDSWLVDMVDAPCSGVGRVP